MHVVNHTVVLWRNFWFTQEIPNLIWANADAIESGCYEPWVHLVYPVCCSYKYKPMMRRAIVNYHKWSYSSRVKNTKLTNIPIILQMKVYIVTMNKIIIIFSFYKIATWFGLIVFKSRRSNKYNYINRVSSPPF